MKFSRFCLLSSIALGFLSCKNKEAAQVKTETGEMSKEEFVKACNQRLNDPKEGKVVSMSLQAFAQAKDCDDAYEKIKALVAKTKG